MKINFRQVIIIIIWISIVLAFTIIPRENAKIVGLIYSILLSVFLYRIYWSLGTSDNEELELKKKIIEKIRRKICPFCDNDYGKYVIKVGYTKRIWTIKYRIFYVSYLAEYKEIKKTIPICDRCKNKYLKNISRGIAIFTRNPSGAVLKRKMGYWRGLRYPFEKYNIKLSEEN